MYTTQHQFEKHRYSKEWADEMRRVPLPTALILAELWILFSAWCCVTGWSLSFVGKLNPAGYAIAGVCGFLSGWAWFKRRLAAQGGFKASFALRQIRIRRHPVAKCFFVLAALALIGGILYPPCNYDALTYRLPRVYHWLEHQSIYWVATNDGRINETGQGFELQMAPVLLFLRSERWLFLLNFIPFLLFPPLIFTSFYRLGISKRASYFWMWLLPSGYCFVLQAASIGNDSIAGVYVVAATAFVLRAKETKNFADLAIGAIASALATASKPINAPLLLPILICAYPALKTVRFKAVPLALCSIAWILCSFIPGAVANRLHTGRFSGLVTAALPTGGVVTGVLGNSLMLVSSNIQPPLLPVAKSVNAVIPKLESSSKLLSELHSRFPRFCLSAGELQIEEGAGIGLGLTSLCAVTLIAGAFGKNTNSQFRRNRTGLLVFLTTGFGLFIYMAMVGSEATARLVAAYYPFLTLGVLLLPNIRDLIQRKWWQWVALLTAISSVPLLILTPARPLWPAITVCKALLRHSPKNSSLKRALVVYETYRNRSAPFQDLLAKIPDHERTIGFLGEDEVSASLFRPFGKRKVVEVISQKSWEHADARYLITSEAAPVDQFHVDFETFLDRFGLQSVATSLVTVKVSRGKQKEYLLLRRSSSSSPGSAK